jgi:hypothetical protein
MSNCGCLLELIQQCDFTFRIHSTCVVFMGYLCDPKTAKSWSGTDLPGPGVTEPLFHKW